jgi:hypothetical protein
MATPNDPASIDTYERASRSQPWRDSAWILGRHLGSGVHRGVCRRWRGDPRQERALLHECVVPSVQSGETQGLSLFTQYNPHGFFIALEALAYLMMTAAFLFAAPVFAGGKVERVIRGLFVLTFILGIVSFVGQWLLRHDLVAFEVTILMIDWLALIVGGALLALVFRRAGRPSIASLKQAARPPAAPIST